MTHYYSKDLGDLESKPKQFDYVFNDTKFIFHSDLGVFSKDFVDYGSYALLKAYKPTSLEGEVLDMGSGYGVIGIIISKIHNKKTVMCEINPRSYELSLKNIEANKVNSEAYNSDLYEKVENRMFAQVVTNPPIRAGKKVVYAIYDGAYEHLLPGGELWVVIQKKQGAPSSMDHINELFGNCEIVERDHGYYILKAIKK